VLSVVASLDGRGLWVCVGSGSSHRSSVVLLSVEGIDVVVLGIKGVDVVSMLEALNILQTGFEKCADDAGQAVVRLATTPEGEERQRSLTMRQK
jgi:hypothetical protein